MSCHDNDDDNDNDNDDGKEIYQGRNRRVRVVTKKKLKFRGGTTG